MMRAAGRAGQRICDTAFAAIEPGTTEGAAIGAGLAEAAQIPGCVHWSFLASGPDSSVLARNSQPSWVPDHVYERGAMVQADCYGWVDGYAYHLARSVVVGGDATPAQTRVMDAARGPPRRSRPASTPGVTCRELHRVCMDYLDDCGLAPVAVFGTQDEEAKGARPGVRALARRRFLSSLPDSPGHRRRPAARGPVRDGLRGVHRRRPGQLRLPRGQLPADGGRAWNAPRAEAQPPAESLIRRR